MNRACVIGWPVEHSLSPAIHGYWLRLHGIEGEYRREAVLPEDLRRFMGEFEHRRDAGGNITLPHKVEALRYCAVLDDAANRIGAVNTVWLENGMLCGSNTDAAGFLASLDEGAPGWDAALRPAVMFGSGGAARAILWALRQRGFGDIRIVNRTVESAARLAAEFGVGTAYGSGAANAALLGAGVIVNASSLGMVGNPPLAIDLRFSGADAVVCDIVYRPLDTSLLRAARNAGLRAVDGLGMLLHQAVPGFEKWFGVRPKVTAALRAAVLDSLREKAKRA